MTLQLTFQGGLIYAAMVAYLAAFSLALLSARRVARALFGAGFLIAVAAVVYRGVQAGWLDAAYLAHADRMRGAAHAKVDAFGLVQGVCGAPHFDRSGTAPEGQAFFLLMEAAYRDCTRTS